MSAFTVLLNCEEEEEEEEFYGTLRKPINGTGSLTPQSILWNGGHTVTYSEFSYTCSELVSGWSGCCGRGVMLAKFVLQKSPLLMVGVLELLLYSPLCHIDRNLEYQGSGGLGESCM